MGKNNKKIVAVTACPTGIAHTYMAAELLTKAAAKAKVSIKVETQGAMGIEQSLSANDIANAGIIIIASDINIENAERFQSYTVHKIPMDDVLTDVDAVLSKLITAN